MLRTSTAHLEPSIYMIACVLTHNHSGFILPCVLSENVLLVTVIVYTQYIHRSHNQYHHVHVYYKKKLILICMGAGLHGGHGDGGPVMATTAGPQDRL